MNTEHVLVTGGTGFVGSAIIQALIEQHPAFDLTILGVKQPGRKSVQSQHVQYTQADVTKRNKVVRAVRQISPSVIIHAAGIVPAGNARYTRVNRNEVFNVNVGGTKTMLEAARQCGVKTFVYTSSCTVITDDVDTDYLNMSETLPSGKYTAVKGRWHLSIESAQVLPLCPPCSHIPRP